MNAKETLWKMASRFPQRKIGDTLVSALGLGCMGMTHAYASGGFDEDESFRVLTRAADMGITFWDTSDAYGPFTNELLLGKWFRQTGRRDEIFLATKFGVRIVNGEVETLGDPAYVRKACAESLQRLQTDWIDLYYQHRVDPNTPIEKTVHAMAELKSQGKIRHLGLSECSARTMRRAQEVASIAAVQMEYSPFSLDIEQNNILQTARELGISIVAYSPLGGGFLAGRIKSRGDFDPNDVRLFLPRFSEENFEDNLHLADTLASIAQRKGCLPGQLSLAWVLAQGEDFIPIPGTKHLIYLEQNSDTINVVIDSDDEKEIRRAIDRVGGTKGARYPPSMLANCFGDSIELEEA